MDCTEAQAMLDRLMDGELSEEERQLLASHGQTCADCAAAIRATMQMKALFEEIEPETALPLSTQAKWREAVRVEAHRQRTRKLYRRIGAAAAAVVVLVSIGVMINRDNLNNASSTPQAEILEQAPDFVQESGYEYEATADDFLAAEATVIETDGEIVMEEAQPQSIPVQEIALVVEDIDAACTLITDLIEEYEGEIDILNTEGGTNLCIMLSSQNVAEFISAITPLNQSGEFPEIIIPADGNMMELLLVVRKIG